MKENPENKCPYCNVCGVTKMSYHHQISVLQVPSTLKTINPVVHMHKINQPKPVHPDPPPGVKVRIESSQIELKENEIFVHHDIWVEAPPEISAIDIHLDIEEVLPAILREYQSNEAQTVQTITDINDVPILEAPRLKLKDNCDDFAMFELKPQLISRGTQTEDKYFARSTRTIGIQTDREMTKGEKFNVIKQLDALIKIMDWVDVVSRAKKLQ